MRMGDFRIRRRCTCELSIRNEVNVVRCVKVISFVQSLIVISVERYLMKCGCPPFRCFLWHIKCRKGFVYEIFI